MIRRRKQSGQMMSPRFSERKKRKTLIVAHRGAKSLAKIENTIESFQIAIDLNIKMVEFDVRRTKDNQLIVFHNPSIKKKKISDITYSELCDITRKHGYEVPRLIDVLRLCQGKIQLDVELKECGYEKEVISLVTSYFSYNQFIVKSFSDQVVKEVKQLDPNIFTGLLIGREKATLIERLQEIYPIKRLKDTNADFVAAHYHLVTRFLIYLCKKHKYEIFVWTVNEDKIYKRLIKQRVTAIVTDYPQKYINSSL